MLGMWDVNLHPYHEICVESKPTMLIVDRQIHLVLNTLGNPTYIIAFNLPMLFCEPSRGLNEKYFTFKYMHWALQA